MEKKNVLKRNPHIQELTQRLSVLQRGVTFGKIFRPGDLSVKKGLDRSILLKLVLQHLDARGLKDTKKALEKEAKLKCPSVELSESRLVRFTGNALKASEKVFDLAIADKGTTEVDLEEHLYSLSLLEDEIQEEDVNMWSEPKDNIWIEKKTDKGLDDEEELDIVKAASFNKLVERLTPESKHDLQFSKTFLMTYQSFSTPEKLFAKLLQRFSVPKNYLGGSEEGKQAIVMIQLRVCNVIRKWIDSNWSDWDEKLIGQLKIFIEQLRSDGQNALASMLSKSLTKQEGKKASGKVSKIFSEKTPEPIVPRIIFFE
eukprot:TRINITY_DN7421_c0_g1_i1.p1 TRINITY_DN7421_c0_g1~~TRINITY_DN7421_c0_g1_i1.p1  ORF type:complete len:314 (-),score=77.92 TRINITY_DN7421_c0_g1_i1:666-1607(-)